MPLKKVYSPAEDSFLLSKVLKRLLKSEKRGIRILDMGSGSGIQAQTCIDLGFSNILAADINPESVKELKKKNIQSVISDLFSAINERFDLVIFNPPYLPYDRHDSCIDTCGGKKGNETILRFLKESRNHLKKNGKLVVLFSSLSFPQTILNQAKKLKFHFKKIADENYFFEKLFVFLFWE